MKIKKKLKKTFGKRIDIWDIILLILIVGSAYFILKNTTTEDLLMRISWMVLGATLITFATKKYQQLRSKARRW